MFHVLARLFEVVVGDGVAPVLVGVVAAAIFEGVVVDGGG